MPTKARPATIRTVPMIAGKSLIVIASSSPIAALAARYVQRALAASAFPLLIANEDERQSGMRWMALARGRTAAEADELRRPTKRRGHRVLHTQTASHTPRPRCACPQDSENGLA